MSTPSVDEKIAAERHSALAYSSYSDGHIPTSKNKKSSSSPFFQFSYIPKRAVVFACIAGFVLLAGGLSALLRADSSDEGLGKTDTSSQAVESGEYIGYDGEISVSEQAKTTDTKTKKQDDNSIISSTLQTLGLIQNTSTSKPQTSTKQPTKSPIITSAPATKASKLLVFVVKNQSYSAMKTSMPYLYGLATKYSYATKYYATSRPSLPNYVAIATGSSRGISNNKAPSTNEFNGTSVFGNAIRAGKTGALYMESMPSNCKLTNSFNGSYVVNHNPWAYVENERGLCQQYNRAMDGFSAAVTKGSLPNVGMVVPNMCNGGYSCSVSVTNTWLQTKLGKVFSGSDWKSGKLAVAVTSDQASTSDSSNQSFFILIHPSQKKRVASCTINHYSLSRLYSDVAKVSRIKNAQTASSISSCFGLPI